MHESVNIKELWDQYISNSAKCSVFFYLYTMTSNQIDLDVLCNAYSFGGMHNGKEGHHVMRSKRSYTHMERFTFAECTYVDISRFLEKSG